MFRFLARYFSALAKVVGPQCYLAHFAQNATNTGPHHGYRHDRQHHIQNAQARRGSKRGQQTKGRGVAGIGIKLHLVITADGHVIEGCLTGAETSDHLPASELLKDCVGVTVLADGGYDSDALRNLLLGQNCQPHIKPRKNRKEALPFNKSLYKLRN
jgi:IS5 family transposase